MTARKIVWVAFGLVLVGFLGVAWLALQGDQPVVQVVEAPVEVPRAEPVAVQPVVPAEAEQTYWLLAASKPLNAGHFVTLDDFRWQEVSQQQRDSMIQPLQKDQAIPGDWVGSLLRRKVAEGELLTPAVMLKPKDFGYLAALVKPGHRAMSVAVSQRDASFRLVSPGDSVDVIFSSFLNNGRGEKFEDQQALRVRTLLTNSRILAVDDQASDVSYLQQPESRRSERPDENLVVTLEVTPEQAELLALATSMSGRLMISTRNQSDAGHQVNEDMVSINIADVIPEVKLAGPEVGVVLMRGVGTEYVGQQKIKKEANEE